MVQHLGAFAAFAEGLSSVLSTHIWCLKSCMRSVHKPPLHAYMHTYKLLINKNKNKIF